MDHRIGSVHILGRQIPVFHYNTIVVGSGAAGFSAAERLHALGQTDIAIVTEGIHAGTSRNTGSDKQTYYKLTLSGSEGDSVFEMARTLFDGGAVDWDLALCEAALSTQCFCHLVELGVPFPRNRYGEFVGYKTDHDPRQRATSAGPYTSKMMTECLQRSVEQKNIRIHDNLQVIRILTAQQSIRGVLCISLTDRAREEYVVFQCKNIIYATGGPAGIYANSAYPRGHLGASGIAFLAGVRGKNLTEWQYGLASLRPRWNVSGTYMQVLPRFFSTDLDGNDEHEFLPDYFSDQSQMLDCIFLKGYQWPFDVRKVNGSSLIDVIVAAQLQKNRRVFLDYRQNPGGTPLDFTSLSDEVRQYFTKANACFGTPIERLCHMNQPAVDFYKDRGIDLHRSPLEISLCAQHNNGGIEVDCWWHTCVDGFFAVGEAAATHGVYRPGGSALNAGQVGALRAAQYIVAHRKGMPDEEIPVGQVEEALRMACDVLAGAGDDLTILWKEAAQAMSQSAGPIRNIQQINSLIGKVELLLNNFSDRVKVSGTGGIPQMFRFYDLLICQYVSLCAMKDYIAAGGKSRGGALYTDLAGQKPVHQLPDEFAFALDPGNLMGMVQTARYEQGCCHCDWRSVHPVLLDDDMFETVWREYRQSQWIY